MRRGGIGGATGVRAWVDPRGREHSRAGLGAVLLGFPVYCVTLAGISPRRATDFLASPRKSAKKATRPPRSFAARMTSLRCSQQAAGAELALRAQTAAPDFPACWCAARRGGTGFSDTPSLYGRNGWHWPLIICISFPSGAPTGGFGRRKKGCACLSPQGEFAQTPPDGPGRAKVGFRGACSAPP